MWTLEDVRRFYATVGQRTQHEEYKTPKIDEYHKLEEQEIYNIVKKGSVVLEAGCGQGRIIDLLKDKCANIIGIDFVQEVAENTAEKFKNYKNVKVIYGDVSDMPYIPDESVDYVLCTFNTLGTIPEPYDKKAVEEFKRVVKPNGKIVISVYSKNALKEQLALYEKANWEVIAYDDKAVYTAEGLVSRRYNEKELFSYFDNDKRFNVEVKPLNEVSLMLIAEKVEDGGGWKRIYFK